MALTDSKHLETVKRVQAALEGHKTDLQTILDEIQGDDDIDGDIKEGLADTIADLEEIKDDLGGFTGEEDAAD